MTTIQCRVHCTHRLLAPGHIAWLALVLVGSAYLAAAKVPTDDTVLEEVLITAQKRNEENTQHTLLATYETGWGNFKSVKDLQPG